MNILGISGFYHDSAACLVQDGRIVAAAQEERFTRVKHDHRFPRHAVAYCLRAGRLGERDLDAVAFYDKPITKFSRILSTYVRKAPKGLASFLRATPLWLREKLWTPYLIERQLRDLGFAMPSKLYFTEHHESHAASAFYPSPFQFAAVLTMDGVGEWATSTIGVGSGHSLTLRTQLRFPHSLGLLYAAFTHFAGFKINSGEYKLMGLAPYGTPRFADVIRRELIDLRDDGSFRMNPKYFNYLGGLTMTNQVFAELFGGPPRVAEARITQREADIAASIQAVTEEIVLRMANHAVDLAGSTDLCLAGGVALNCVANGRLLRESRARRLWIQPAAGDAGGALGCALYVWHQIQGNARVVDPMDRMEGSYLGPSFSNDEIRSFLAARGIPFRTFESDEDRAEQLSAFLAQGKVIGLFLGRMEFGPRALGHRSIIGDPRSPTMQSLMNLKIKYRESFRPFAPSVLKEDADRYFDLSEESPYMLLVGPVKEELRAASTSTNHRCDDLVGWVNEVRSTIPAVTHVDYSARVQTVSRERNRAFHDIIKAFRDRTGTGVVVNTSFNVRGEPIVCTPADAYRCFMRTKMDYLVLEHQLVERTAQPDLPDDGRWRETFQLD